MEVNSANQTWSKWVWIVKPAVTFRPSRNEVVNKFATVGKKWFGSATEMRLRQKNKHYIIEYLTEGHPVNDPTYVEFTRKSWQELFEKLFGIGTVSKLTARIMAGSKQDGSPAEQMIILPTISVSPASL
jgi:hypothetical protein